jgi:TRAP-type C4-dicarboxylate transport system permease small subunit
MKNLFYLLKSISRILNIIAGISLTFMMLLTVIDVLLRTTKYPIVGTFEVVSLSLALVVGFGIPQVSLDRGHVSMDFLVEKLSLRAKKIMNTFTRILCLVLFIFIGYNLFNVGAMFRAAGEVTATIKLPFYPLAYAVGVCCLLECFVFLFEIIRIWGEKYE